MVVTDLLKFYDKPIHEPEMSDPFTLLVQKGFMDELNEIDPMDLYDRTHRTFNDIVILENKDRIKKMRELRLKEIKRKILFLHYLIEEFKLIIVCSENLKLKQSQGADLSNKIDILMKNKDKISEYLHDFIKTSNIKIMVSNYYLFKNNISKLHE